MTLWEQMHPPVDISENGHLIDFLFRYTTYMNIFFFALVCAGLFGFTYFYYHKRSKKAYYTYGNKKPHILIATVIGTLVFFAVDLNITRMSNNDYINVFINWPKDDDPNVLKVQVLAQQWAWNFRYAGKDGVFNTEDDIVLLNDLHVPTGKKVLFQVLSKDVIHSLYFPNARRKVDAIPGRITRLWYQLKTPGTYDIACAEMCGTYHYRMQAKLYVHTPENFQDWLSEAEAKALEDNRDASPERYWGWQWQMAANQ